MAFRWLERQEIIAGFYCQGAGIGALTVSARYSANSHHDLCLHACPTEGQKGEFRSYRKCSGFVGITWDWLQIRFSEGCVFS